MCVRVCVCACVCVCVRVLSPKIVPLWNVQGWNITEGDRAMWVQKPGRRVYTKPLLCLGHEIKGKETLDMVFLMRHATSGSI